MDVTRGVAKRKGKGKGRDGKGRWLSFPVYGQKNLTRVTKYPPHSPLFPSKNPPNPSETEARQASKKDREIEHWHDRAARLDQLVKDQQ